MLSTSLVSLTELPMKQFVSPLFFGAGALCRYRHNSKTQFPTSRLTDVACGGSGMANAGRLIEVMVAFFPVARVLACNHPR